MKPADSIGSKSTDSHYGHIVKALTIYTYDSNGNMLTRGTDNITWDAENRPVSVSYAGGTENYTYDGDGKRVKKIVNGQTTLYINRYYEKSGSDNISYYYLGSKLIATAKDTTLTYIHQDHLGGTSVVTDSSGSSVAAIKYTPFGTARSSSGTLPEKLFTGQRRDIATAGSELYYYGARYYDPQIGRFISADTIVPNPMNPQSLNRYAYCLNNPLRYVDPSGHEGEETAVGTTTVDGETYNVVRNADGTYKLVGSRGQSTGSAPLQQFLGACPSNRSFEPGRSE